MSKKIVLILGLGLVFLGLTVKPIYAFWPFDQIKSFINRLENKPEFWPPPPPPPGRGGMRPRLNHFFWEGWGRHIWPGKVKTIGDNQFTIQNDQNKDQSDITVLIDKTTLYHLATEKWQGSFSDIKIGSIVRVFGQVQDNNILAKRIIILPDNFKLTPNPTYWPGGPGEKGKPKPSKPEIEE